MPNDPIKSALSRLNAPSSQVQNDPIASALGRLNGSNVKETVSPTTASSPTPDKGRIGNFIDEVSSNEGGKLGTPNNSGMTEGDKARLAGVIQGTVNLGHHFYSFVSDLAKGLGISKGDAGKERANWASEKTQYENLPYVKGNKLSAKIPEKLIEYGGLAAPGTAIAKGLGLISGMARGLAGDVLAGATASAIADPETSKNSLLDRAKNAAVGGAVSGAIGLPLRAGSAAISGSYSPATAAAQTELYNTAKNKFGVELGPAQLVTNPERAETVKAVQGTLGQLPLVGGKGSMLKKKQSVINADEDFVNSLKSNGQKAKESFDNISKTLDDKLGKFSVKNSSATSEANKVLDKLTGISRPSEDMLKLKDAAINILNSPGKTFSDYKLLRQNLDDLLYGSGSSGAMKGGPLKDMAKTLRGSMEKDLETAAKVAGKGKEYFTAKKDYRDFILMDKIQKLYNNSLEGSGILNPATFGTNLTKKSKSLMSGMSVEAKDTFKGLIKLHQATSQILKTKRGLNYQAAFPVAATATGAVAVGHAPIAAGAGAVFKGISYLLDSKVGRQLLTYVGKQSSKSTNVSDIALKLIQGSSAAIASQSQQGTK